MREIHLVCGEWYLSENLWYFFYDPTRAARVLCVTARLSYADFLVMVYEEYRLESDPRWRIKLSYKLARKTHLDIPPVAVCNQRQFEMFIRQCKAKGRSKLCLEIEEIEAIKPKIVAEEPPNKRQCKIPCVHALAAADTAKVSSVLQCHPYYRTDSLRKGYSELIMPKDSACELPDSVISTVCNPPLAKTQSGRPKLSRFKGKMETGPVGTKPRKQHVCSVCNHTGHNSQTCKVLV